MYHSEEIIRQLQSQKILAMKLDQAVRAVGEEVKSQLSNIGKQPVVGYPKLPARRCRRDAQLFAVQHP